MSFVDGKHFFYLSQLLTIVMALDCSTVNIHIEAAGSSFPADMYQEMGASYSANRSLDRQIFFNYERVNSVYGKDRIKMTDISKGPIVFAGSEATLSPEDKNAYPELTTFPAVAGALAIVFKLPKINTINLTTAAVVDIYSGKIKYWDDKTIQMVNPNAILPSQRILVVARSDVGAGDTLIFTTALSAISDEWSQSYGSFVDPKFVGGDCCNSTKWPTNVVEFFGNRVTGLVGIVASIPYTIGYAAWANTIGTGVTFAKIFNANGQLTEPNTESVQSAMNYFLDKSKSQNGLEYNISYAKSSQAYPFASFSYMIVNRTVHPNISFCAMQELTGYVTWLFAESHASIIVKYGLVPLSSAVQTYIMQNVLPQINSDGKSAYNEFLISLIPKRISNDLRTAVIVVAVLLSAITLIGAAILWQYRKTRIRNQCLWLLNDIELMSPLFDQRSSTTSAGSKTHVGLLSNISMVSKEYHHPTDRTHLIEGRLTFSGTTVYMTKIITMKTHSNWSNKTKLFFTKSLREIRHINLLAFLGVTTVDDAVYLVNQNILLKGTLHYVMSSCPYDINDNIKSNIALEILEGLKYLHQIGLVHGFLSSLTCHVDVVWSVKISNWQLYQLASTESLNTFAALFAAKDNINTEEKLVQLLYVDPELLSGSEKLPYRSDVYSYGMLLVEIFTRRLPYLQEVELELNDYPNIIKEKFDGKWSNPQMNPVDVPLKIQRLVEKSLTSYARRLDMGTLHKTMKEYVGNRKSVVDILMQAMERYMDDLEAKVTERTSELSTMTLRMRELLHDVLPAQIATKLFRGETVEPEFFECCTILFSDIVGFTTISARSTPIQVMTFLNGLYTLFDKIMEKYDVYKVDTIGDSYMVASGIPQRNGMNHLMQIATLSIKLMEHGSQYQIPHLPDEKLMTRMGINSGPVTAGIIGRKMPQYCVFGDTVNVASRMESTSVPYRIQVTDNSHALYEEYFSDRFNFEFRGEVEVKGKGRMKSFWLISQRVTT